jgi:hypothetical protein
MRSTQLETALTEFFEAAATYLHGEVLAGAEVPFELGAQNARRGGSATTLYCYRALTGQFISEREAALKRLPPHAEVAKLLERFDGLDRYLASAGGDAARAKGRTRVRAAVKALLEEVFDDQTDFELRPERLEATLERLQQSTLASAGEVTLVANLYGVTIASSELQLTKGLRIVPRDGLLHEMPEGVITSAEDEYAEDHLLVAFSSEQEDVGEALAAGRAVLKDLLSALRLFGDGRVTLGSLAWARVGNGPWTPLALGTSGRPHGMLVVTAEQEDELRAFCNLVSRRAPHDNDLAWALRRFELGCERETPYEALTDHLLALRALLEPEGPSSGQLAGRLAALCATPEQRGELTERMVRAVALERSLIAGTAAKNAASRSLAEDVANHLRSLLRDVICGHLDPDLAVIADEMLEPDELLHADEQGDGEFDDDVEFDASPVLAAAAAPVLGLHRSAAALHQADDLAEPADEYEQPLDAGEEPGSQLGLERFDEQEQFGGHQEPAEQPLPIDGFVSSLS